MRIAAYMVAGLTAMMALAAPADGISYVPARQIVLTFAAGDGDTVDAAELWVSTDGGRAWQLANATQLDESSLKYEARADGTYAFYLVLKNAAGASAPPPGNGSRPHSRVIVDTVPPTLQLHPAGSPTAPVAGMDWQLRATLIDENRGDTGVRVFYRTSENAPWTDGGAAPVREGQLTWHVPPDLAGAIDLRAVATDLAGNRAEDELRGVHVAPAPVAPGEPPTAPQSSAPPPKTETGSVMPAEPAHVPPAEPVVLDPAPEPAASQPTLEPGGQEYLKRLAARFMVEQRYELAAARLEDALAASPDDADLLVDLGSALYWSGRYEDAGARFSRALEARPDHTGALEGLALVAATQKRYPQARTYLQRLLRLTPRSGQTWLRYGDIEHKLGNLSLALEAWERVLELDDADEELRQKAERRIGYFGPARRQARP